MIKMEEEGLAIKKYATIAAILIGLGVVAIIFIGILRNIYRG